MKNMMTFLTAFFIAATSNAVILLPGKIEEPNRANKIIAEKYKLKKAYLDKHRKRIKEKFATVKNGKPDVAANLATPAPLREEATIRSKGVAADGTMVPEQGKQFQETR